MLKINMYKNIMLTKIISIILISSFTITNIGYCNDAIYYRNISSSYIANKGLRVPVAGEIYNLRVPMRFGRQADVKRTSDGKASSAGRGNLPGLAWHMDIGPFISDLKNNPKNLAEFEDALLNAMQEAGPRLKDVLYELKDTFKYNEKFKWLKDMDTEDFYGLLYAFRSSVYSHMTRELILSYEDTNLIYNSLETSGSIRSEAYPLVLADTRWKDADIKESEFYSLLNSMKQDRYLSSRIEQLDRQNGYIVEDNIELNYRRIDALESAISDAIEETGPYADDVFTEVMKNPDISWIWGFTKARFIDFVKKINAEQPRIFGVYCSAKFIITDIQEAYMLEAFSGSSIRSKALLSIKKAHSSWESLGEYDFNLLINWLRSKYGSSRFKKELTVFDKKNGYLTYKGIEIDYSRAYELEEAIERAISIHGPGIKVVSRALNEDTELSWIGNINGKTLNGLCNFIRIIYKRSFSVYVTPNMAVGGVTAGKILDALREAGSVREEALRILKENNPGWETIDIEKFNMLISRLKETDYRGRIEDLDETSARNYYQVRQDLKIELSGKRASMLQDAINDVIGKKGVVTDDVLKEIKRDKRCYWLKPLTKAEFLRLIKHLNNAYRFEIYATSNLIVGTKQEELILEAFKKEAAASRRHSGLIWIQEHSGIFKVVEVEKFSDLIDWIIDINGSFKERLREIDIENIIDWIAAYIQANGKMPNVQDIAGEFDISEEYANKIIPMDELRKIGIDGIITLRDHIKEQIKYNRSLATLADKFLSEGAYLVDTSDVNKGIRMINSAMTLYRLENNKAGIQECAYDMALAYESLCKMLYLKRKDRRLYDYYRAKAFLYYIESALLSYQLHKEKRTPSDSSRFKGLSYLQLAIYHMGYAFIAYDLEKDSFDKSDIDETARLFVSGLKSIGVVFNKASMDLILESWFYLLQLEPNRNAIILSAMSWPHYGASLEERKSRLLKESNEEQADFLEAVFTSLSKAIEERNRQSFNNPYQSIIGEMSKVVSEYEYRDLNFNQFEEARKKALLTAESLHGEQYRILIQDILDTMRDVLGEAGYERIILDDRYGLTYGLKLCDKALTSANKLSEANNRLDINFIIALSIFSRLSNISGIVESSAGSAQLARAVLGRCKLIGVEDREMFINRIAERARSYTGKAEAYKEKELSIEEILVIDADESLESPGLKRKTLLNKLRKLIQEGKFPIITTDKDGSLIDEKMDTKTCEILFALFEKRYELYGFSLPFIIMTNNTKESTIKGVWNDLVHAFETKYSHLSAEDFLEKRKNLFSNFIIAATGGQIWVYDGDNFTLKDEIPMQDALVDKIEGIFGETIKEYSYDGGHPTAECMPEHPKGKVIDKRLGGERADGRVIGITLVAPGKDIEKEERNRFDPDRKKRSMWAKFIINRFNEDPELKELYVEVSGKTSIDVVLGTKSYRMERLTRFLAERLNIPLDDMRDRIIYFGDEFYEGGGDASLKGQVGLLVNLGRVDVVDLEAIRAGRIFVNPDNNSLLGPDRMRAYLKGILALTEEASSIQVSNGALLEDLKKMLTGEEWDFGLVIKASVYLNKYFVSGGRISELIFSSVILKPDAIIRFIEALEESEQYDSIMKKLLEEFFLSENEYSQKEFKILFEIVVLSIKASYPEGALEKIMRFERLINDIDRKGVVKSNKIDFLFDLNELLRSFKIMPDAAFSARGKESLISTQTSL